MKGFVSGGLGLAEKGAARVDGMGCSLGRRILNSRHQRRPRAPSYLGRGKLNRLINILINRLNFGLHFSLEYQLEY